MRGLANSQDTREGRTLKVEEVEYKSWRRLTATSITTR
jgi:hypothetical protein